MSAVDASQRLLSLKACDLNFINKTNQKRVDFQIPMMSTILSNQADQVDITKVVSAGTFAKQQPPHPGCVLTFQQSRESRTECGRYGPHMQCMPCKREAY